MADQSKGFPSLAADRVSSRSPSTWSWDYIYNFHFHLFRLLALDSKNEFFSLYFIWFTCDLPEDLQPIPLTIYIPRTTWYRNRHSPPPSVHIKMANNMLTQRRPLGKLPLNIIYRKELTLKIIGKILRIREANYSKGYIIWLKLYSLIQFYTTASHYKLILFLIAPLSNRSYSRAAWAACTYSHTRFYVHIDTLIPLYSRTDVLLVYSFTSSYINTHTHSRTATWSPLRGTPI